MVFDVFDNLFWICGSCAAISVCVPAQLVKACCCVEDGFEGIHAY